MKRAARHLQHLWGDEQGATIVEFALILTPMLLLVMGGFELAYESYLRAAMQGAVSDAARRASVEDPVFAQDGDTLAEQVEEAIREAAAPIAPDAEVSVTQTSYFEFSDVGNPELLMTDNNDDGTYDEADGDCFEDANANGEFDTDSAADGRGASDDVVFYRAEITAARLLPVEAFTGFDDEFTITLETAIRNQPFGDRAVPPVVCGDD